MTERLEREGMTTEEQDPLIRSLANALDQCCEELGERVGGVGCDWCPCRVECERLFYDGPGRIIHNLTMTEYRKLSQKLYLLKQKRNQMLERQGILLAAHKPA